MNKVVRRTAGVSGRWEGGDSPLKRKKLKATKKLKKRAAYPPVHCTHCWAALLGMMLAIKKQLKPK